MAPGEPRALRASRRAPGLLAGIAVGGAFIVVGQRLRIAVDSVNLQAAMLDRLDEISTILAHRAETQGGRFRPLAGE